MSFQYTYLHGYLIIAHSNKPPEDLEWQNLLRDIIAYQNTLQGLLVDTEWIVTGQYYRDIMALCQYYPLAVLCDISRSQSLWLTATSIFWSWGLQKSDVKLFDPGDYQGALDHLKVPQNQRDAILTTLLKMKAALSV